jgi:hypothetical protein
LTWIEKGGEISIARIESLAPKKVSRTGVVEAIARGVVHKSNDIVAS